MILDEFKKINSSPKKLRQFGMLLMILAGITALILHKKQMAGSGYMVAAAGCAGIIAVLVPSLLKPAYLLWMMMAIILGWFMTMIIMTILFYMILTPIGLIARLVGKKFFPVCPDKSAQSYWNDRSDIKFSKEYYERQF